MAKKNRKTKTPIGLDVTPEFMTRFSADLTPAGIQGEIGGRQVHTTWRRKSPIEKIKSLEPHEVQAGQKLHKLFAASNIESVGAVDCSRAVVDCSTSDHVSDHVSDHILDARDALNKAMKVLTPMLMQIVDEIVLHELPIMEFCNNRRCDRRSAVSLLKVALQYLSLHFGYSTVRHKVS